MYKILLATEGSRGSIKAEKEALKLAYYFDAHVTVLVVLPESPPESTTVVYPETERYVSPELFDKLQKMSEKVLQRVESSFEGYSIRIEPKIRNGQPAEVICNEAEKGGYDLIIMGKRGGESEDAPLVGRISYKVAQSCPVNVQLID